MKQIETGGPKMTVETKRELSLPTSLRDLGKPSLHALSYCLRHPDTWPEGFYWDFADCQQCAMGLAHELWSAIPSVDRRDGPSVMARTFAMPYEQAERIFLGEAYRTEHLFGILTRYPGHDNITPEMVANAIDAYLEKAE